MVHTYTATLMISMEEMNKHIMQAFLNLHSYNILYHSYTGWMKMNDIGLTPDTRNIQIIGTNLIQN